LEVSTGGRRLFAQYIKDAVSYIEEYALDGKKLNTIGLPGLGTASGFSNKREEKEVYYSFTSYVFPSTIFRYDIASRRSTIYKKPSVKFDPQQYESKQVFYNSKDGTRIPMIITYKKGTQLTGNNPLMLYAYGGFNVSLTPGFSVSNLVFMENGGVYAVANLRGGGEYGDAWHNAGTKMQKQNVFDDFIAAAEFLIKEKYTSKDYLAISGGSNGGLLVGACMAQRPELYRVCFPAVGVMDMLRYHKFTAGAGWAYDYGTADDNKEMFEYLYKYSPVHNLRKGTCYPATLVTTADHDDRVVPAHSFKFAATLQSAQSCENPVLISIATKAGHGSGKPTTKIIEEQADKWSFLLYNMGLQYKQ
jgi:prolyl oligopeptidase